MTKQGQRRFYYHALLTIDKCAEMHLNSKSEGTPTERHQFIKHIQGNQQSTINGLKQSITSGDIQEQTTVW
jgi:hypothetical protein